MNQTRFLGYYGIDRAANEPLLVPMALHPTFHPRGPTLTEASRKQSGFTLAEVLVSVSVCVLFGMAAFQTNQRLLVALKSQKETTAAIMALQERKETLRAMAFSEIATGDDLKNVLLHPTGSESPLANLAETITVSVDPNDAAYTSPSPTPTVIRRDLQHSGPQKVTENTNLPNYNLLRVDILLTWTSANGRPRSRQSSELFGHGNIGQ